MESCKMTTPIEEKFTNKTVTVTTTKTIEVWLDKDCLLESQLDAFEKYFFKLKGKETRGDALFAVCARQVAEYDESFIEGVGSAHTLNSDIVGYYPETAGVLFKEQSVNYETEIEGE